ncbi:MAG: hypothetical protein NVSMB13_04860 [Mycobacteriales bacterium]
MRLPDPRAALAVVGGLLVGLSAGFGGTQGAFSSVTGDAGNTFSAAASFGCAGAATNTVNADADSEVRSSNVGANYGTINTLDVQSDPADMRRTFVHFPLLAMPVGCTVTAASLTFVVKKSDAHTLNAMQVTGPWTELGITWSNQPGTAGPPATAVSAGPTMTFAVGSQVQALYTSGDYGLAVIDSQEGLAAGLTTYASRSDAGGSMVATLSVTFG